MKKKPSNDYLFILIPTCIVVFAWIGFNLYRTAITSTISEAASVQIQPIEPQFDQTTVTTIKQRTQVAPRLIAPTPMLTPTAQQEILIPTPSPQDNLVIPTPTPGVSANDQGSFTIPTEGAAP